MQSSHILHSVYSESLIFALDPFQVGFAVQLSGFVCSPSCLIWHVPTSARSGVCCIDSHVNPDMIDFPAYHSPPNASDPNFSRVQPLIFHVSFPRCGMFASATSMFLVSFREGTQKRDLYSLASSPEYDTSIDAVTVSLVQC